jgi:hypothetical protein
MTFGIYDGIYGTSELQTGTTYIDVLTGVTANLISNFSGSFNGLAWRLSLEAGSSVNWDLLVGPFSTTDITPAGSPHLASDLGVSVNPTLAGGTLQMNLANAT